jgi:predicted nucleic acid-binding protein
METDEERIIIDTDVLVDMLRGEEKTVKVISEFESRKRILSTTVINVFELYYGAYKSKKRLQNLNATRRLLERIIVLKMGSKSAEKAGQIYAELEAMGQTIGLRDLMVGAIAVSRGYTLITGNVKHMQKIKGLNLMAAP